MILFQTKIVRADLKANPDVWYVFGDNLTRTGLGGQAKEMRGEPNALGIVTKKHPSMKADAYFSDDEYGDNCLAIQRDIATVQAVLRQGDTVVFPRNGIGTGLSDMAARCPRTYGYLTGALSQLFAIYTKA